LFMSTLKLAGDRSRQPSNANVIIDP
jgi:hypothetical protein